MTPIKLKNGKRFNDPAIFLNPQNKQDGRILRDTNDLYPEIEGNDGILSIDGLLVDLKDWKEVSDGIKFNEPSLIEQRSMHDRVLIIDHGLDFLLRGNESDRNKMGKTGLFDP